MNRKIEILAPAGSYEGMLAAMNAGCDAVYIGGSSFGARAYAQNLDEETLLRAIDEAHIRNKQIYLTVNTLVKEEERVEQLMHFLDKYYEQGLDAVIVQDLGVMHFVHKHFPDLPIHASTQMTLTMAQGANFLKDYGVTRIVTSRELSFREIRAIRDNTDLEIETFVHGALCYCYSGQCLMSSMIGGRSGNRGRCAQPCRMTYQFFSDGKQISSDEEKYLLSPKDINTLSLVPELIEAGVDSFKIEGRMKRPEYAAAVTSMYRKYVDLYLAEGKERYRKVLKSDEFRRDMLNLADIYNRGGFSEGYGKRHNGRKMMSLARPNHSGVYVGDVISAKGNQVKISLKEDINAQDILEIRKGEEVSYEFTVKNPLETGKVLTANVGKARPTLGSKVYRTKNNMLLESITAEYINQNQKQAIKGILQAKLGESLSLTLTYRDFTVTAYQQIVQEAMKQPMTEEKLLAPIRKTGETPYYFEELKVVMDDHIFVPVAWLNEIRREAIQLLQEKVLASYRRGEVKSKKANVNSDDSFSANQENVSERIPGLCVTVQTREQFDEALNHKDVTAIYVTYDTMAPYGINTSENALDRSEFSVMAEQAAGLGKDFYLVLPHICRLSVYERLNKEIVSIKDDPNIKGYVVRNFEEIGLLQSLYNGDELSSKTKSQNFATISKEIILNYNIYVYNKEAFAFWKEKGIAHFTAPVELNYQELKQLGISECDMVVYGYQPVMISAQCLYESTEGCSRCKDSNQKTGYLLDRIGKKFFVQTNCSACYNTIYNGQNLSLLNHASEVLELSPRNIRLDFTFETAKVMNAILSTFANTFIHNKKTDIKWNKDEFTTGHFKRGIE